MKDSIPEFGSRVVGAVYRLRPGGYGLVRNENGCIAVVKTSTGLFLPGGGQEAGESPEEALLREMREECGLVVRIGRPLGVVDQFAHSVAEQLYYRKRCTFFTALIVESAGTACEPDHELLWMSPEEAAAQLHHESQRWMVLQNCSYQTTDWKVQRDDSE